MLGPKVLLRALVLCATLGSTPMAMAAETEGDMVLSAPVPAREETRLVLPDIPELEPRPRAIVLQIPDGDTLRLTDRRVIRLACIDAPDLALSQPTLFTNQELREENFHVEKDEETQAKGTKKGQRSRRHVEQYFAVEARDALRKLALKRHVTLRAEASRKDPQGRLLADVVLEDGTSLAAFLVENGFAYVVHDPHFPQGYLDALYALQQKAMQARRGFWGRILELEAARLPWTGNTETRLFYSGNDVRSQQIKPRLRMYFGTLLDAFSSGYAPARSRDFWPAADKK